MINLHSNLNTNSLALNHFYMSFNLISLYIVIVILLRHQIIISMLAKISLYESSKYVRSNRVNASTVKKF